MASRVLASLLTLALGAAVSAAPGNEKLVLVSVVAGESQPAAALAPADFQVTEGKDTTQVVEAVPAKDPLSIVLLVDTAVPEGTAAHTPELRNALTSFVATVLGYEPAAQIALYQVANAALPVADFTSDREALDKGIGLIASGTTPGSVMLEGVMTAARLLTARPAPRRAVVCVSVGTAEGSHYLPKDVANAVRKSGATLWVVSVQRSTDASLTNRDAVWERATEDTGGLRLNALQATHLDTQLNTIANSLLSQYVLKIVRKRDGAVSGFKGQTSKGLPVLFTHWIR
jgi:hypothetical protein